MTALLPFDYAGEVIPDRQLADLDYLWQRVISAGERVVDAQAEELRLNEIYSASPSNDNFAHWKEARLQVDRLSKAYDLVMRLYCLSGLEDPA